jgi:hypothetical protein
VHSREFTWPLDQFAAGGASYPAKSFGTVALGAGDHVVRLTVVGKRAESGSFSLTADRITLVPRAPAAATE